MDNCLEGARRWQLYRNVLTFLNLYYILKKLGGREGEGGGREERRAARGGAGLERREREEGREGGRETTKKAGTIMI